MKARSLSASDPEAQALVRARQDLGIRLDDLRGLGLLPGGLSREDPEDEAGLIELALRLVDELEMNQRRLIETSIQVISLRELVAKLLTLRTPEQVAETVVLYLHKAFDHERVLVGVYDPAEDTVDGYLAVRNGEEARSDRFSLDGEWGGELRQVLLGNRPVHASDCTDEKPFVCGEDVPAALREFRPGQLGAYLAYPLSGSGEKDARVVGVIVVGRSGGGMVGEMDAGLLEPVADAVGTAMENVILEEDVRREEAFRKDIMRSMGSGLVAVDLNGRVLAMNAAAQKLTGFSSDELRGETPGSLDPAGGGLTALLEKTLASRRGILRAERAVRRADGSAFPAACATTVLRNPAGEEYGAVVTFEDLTAFKEMEERIRSLDRLAALGRFTAGIAHELRNPLTGIGTGVQYLERQLVGADEHRENLTFIQREIVRLDAIIEDLFRVTHPHPVRKAPEDARAIAHRAVRALGSMPAEAEVEIEIVGPDDLPPVPVDPDQIQQVLLNLIKNGVEATPPGGKVCIHIYASPDDPRPEVVFQVMDTGPGIPETALSQLFEPFFTQGKPKGTGLGLYVSHGIVERHGGELHAANATGEGAIFTLKLPLNDLELTEML